MKKSLVILISLGLILLLSISVVSASWFGDIWKKITGRTTENDTSNQTQPSCTDDCSSNGAKQCSGSGYQTCGNYDSDSCLEWSSATSCSSSETCVQGACVSNTYTCTDSDGGKDYNAKGNVVASSPTSSIDVTDLCSDSNKVVEYFCNPDKTQSGETYTCPNGCSNGACVSGTTNVSNATTSTTSSTTTPTSTTTIASSSGGGGGSSGSGSTSSTTITKNSEGVFEEKTITEEKSEEEVKITTETKKLTDETGNKVEIEIKTEIRTDGTTITEEKREFINKDGKLIKIKLRFENDGVNIKIEREIEVEGKKIESKLEILEKFEGEEVQLKAKLSNGNEREIKIMPDKASEIALEKLETKDFNLELKEVGEGENLQAVYIAKVDKNGKLLGLFKVRLKSEAQINSETGEIINLEKPWWNFLAIKLKEPIELANNQTNLTNITLPLQINVTINNTNNLTNITLPPPINLTNITNITLPPLINMTTNYTCIDSDNGKNYSTKGNVIASSPNSFINVTDLCSSSSVLIEYFCINLQQSGETYTCPNGCSNGACI